MVERKAGVFRMPAFWENGRLPAWLKGFIGRTYKKRQSKGQGGGVLARSKQSLKLVWSKHAEADLHSKYIMCIIYMTCIVNGVIKIW